MSEFDEFQFNNGIRAVHKTITTTKLVHCGFALNIGSRDELEGEEGIAHFWEHMAFKGTNRRKTFHIINRIESVGGEVNAYTTKEKIYFYVSILDTYFERAVELLTDITFYSIFPEKEIEKEKGVIIEEMNMYLDSPEEAINDEFDELIFGEHSLGKNILGTEDSVRKLKRDQFFQFLKNNLTGDKVVFSSVGNVSHQKVSRVLDKYLSEIVFDNEGRNRDRPVLQTNVHKEIKKSITQAHCVIGGEAYGLHHKSRLGLLVLSNLLGGPSLTSRLNLTLREKYGYVYGVECGYTPLSDCGMYSIYFATEMKQLNKSMKIVKREIDFLKEKSLGNIQLKTLKDQILGQLAMSEESNVSLMQMMAKNTLDFGHIESLSSVYQQILSLTSLELQDIANEIFDHDNINSLKYLPL